MARLYGKVAFVEALLYVGRSSMEIQHALLTLYICKNWLNSKAVRAAYMKVLQEYIRT